MSERENITVTEKIRELEYANDVLKDMVDRWEATASKNLDLVNALKVQRDELEDKANSYLDRIERLKKDFGVIYRENKELREATNGHTPENLEQIMKAAPPAGCKFERREAKVGETFWNNWGEWIDIRHATPSWPVFVRTPIVEYIEGDEITDELVQLHGRLPCEIQGEGSDEWVKQGLLVAVDNPYPGIGSATYWTRHDGIMVGWYSCRIKKSDLKKEI